MTTPSDPTPHLPLPEPNGASRICLIGEPDPFIALLLQRYSEKYGLEPVWAKVGDELLGLARSSRPAVLILEPDLPGTLRGWEALRRIRSDAELGQIPVILCTWTPADEVIELTGNAGGHLRKPDLHFEDFMHAMQACHITPAWDNATQGTHP
jgi:CheY-like chemotaxis protein